MTTVFDVEVIGQDYGAYEPMSDVTTIYLGAIYHDFRKDNDIIFNILFYRIIDVLVHECLHEAIDQCLITEKPHEIDDHKVYKFLSEI